MRAEDITTATAGGGGSVSGRTKRVCHVILPADVARKLNSSRRSLKRSWTLQFHAGHSRVVTILVLADGDLDAWIPLVQR